MTLYRITRNTSKQRLKYFVSLPSFPSDDRLKLLNLAAEVSMLVFYEFKDQTVPLFFLKLAILPGVEEGDTWILNIILKQKRKQLMRNLEKYCSTNLIRNSLFILHRGDSKCISTKGP